MGRHTRRAPGDPLSLRGMWTAPPRGRQRRWLAVAAAIVVVATVGVVVISLPGSGAGCGETRRISVAVSAGVKAAVESALRDWNATHPMVLGRCIAASVETSDPADIASALAKRSGLTLLGVAEPSVKTELPDIWIPDSSMWLTRLTQTGVGSLPEGPPSIAQSPVVIATPEAKDTDKTDLKWADVAKQLAESSTTALGLVDPLRDSASLLGVLALRSAVASGDGENRTKALAAATMSLGESRFATSEELLMRVSQSGASAATAKSPKLAMLTESAVLAYNAKQPTVPLRMLEGQPTGAAVDYPFVVVPYSSAIVKAASPGIQKALSGASFTALLTRDGLRAPNDALKTQAASLTGDSGATMTKTVQDWISLNMPSRMLIVIDVSGSMSAPVATANGATREAVTVESAKRGIAMCDEDYDIGLWIFSTNLSSGADYEELVPIKTLTENRKTLNSALSTIRPKPGGMTGLYDTILAGYSKLQSDWDPTRVSTLIVMTDGKNEDPSGPSLDGMLQQLDKMTSKVKPIQIVMLGIGLEVSETELKKIAEPTGGGAFIAPDPTEISDIFLQIMTLRTLTAE